MTHRAIDEIPGGPQGPLALPAREQDLIRELSEACVALGRGTMKRADALAKARHALDSLEREWSACPECGVATLGGPAHASCERAESAQLREWLGSPGRAWARFQRDHHIGGKRTSVTHGARLLVSGKTVAVGGGPTPVAAEIDALSQLPEGRR